jgi:uncharacterized protein YdiU (UPF0061 family)
MTDVQSSPATEQSLEGLGFHSTFTTELPGDEEASNHCRQVFGACYSRVDPTPVAGPTLVAYASEVAALLGLSDDACTQQPFVDVMGGNAVVPGMAPYAACYGGHQFGHWAGQLGDGRAIALGEVVNTSGERYELQLKGAGPTPYSRMGDGRAVLRSSIREFLCSEAMHHLGVPTTRALSLVTTGDAVMRDMFYDGHPKNEPGAIVCRVAPSFLRFGSFEIFASRRDEEGLATLGAYALRTHFPHLGEPSPETYGAWFTEIAQRTALMIDHWMRVGFVHGVMNTDNMSILGHTIDYGPYGWLEGYDPNWTPNTTDAQGRRYAFGNQPHIAMWNLSRFASAIHGLVQDTSLLEAGLDAYRDTLGQAQRATLAAKLGLQRLEGTEDETMVRDLFALLERVETDMTLFYRHLADVPVQAPDKKTRLEAIRCAYYDPDGLPDEVGRAMGDWLAWWAGRIERGGVPTEVRRAQMNGVNPKYVLRNYLAQVAIDAAEQGDFSEVTTLLDVMRRPYDEQPTRSSYAEKRPEWARDRAGCSTLSCSS